MRVRPLNLNITSVPEPDQTIDDLDLAQPNYAPKPKEPQPPAESVIAAEKASAAVIQADKLEQDIRAIIDTVKKRAEQIEREGLLILTDIAERRAVLQSGADSFLERTSKWQTGLRELFAETNERKANG
jgi:hypothetical protein